MNARKLVIAGAVALAATVGSTAAAFAAPSPAPAPAPPSSGIFAGYEGAEVSGYNMAINVHGQVAKPGVTVYGYTFNPADPANRFLWIKPLSGPYTTATAPFGGTLKVAAYAPDGRPTNLVLTEAAGNHVTLQPYDANNIHQVWAPMQYTGDLGHAGWVADAGTVAKMIREAGNNQPLQLIAPVHWKQTMFAWDQIGG
jgi:hypothetical protein